MRVTTAAAAEATIATTPSTLARFLLSTASRAPVHLCVRNVNPATVLYFAAYTVLPSDVMKNVRDADYYAF